MADPADVDAATEALIAQLVAEDLGESYQRHSTPIGASYHDYEEPLSSYERQCLDAENDSDADGEEGSGWGPDDPDGVNVAAAPNEDIYSTETANDGTWDSRFVDDNGQVQEHNEPEQTPQAIMTDEDDNRSEPQPCSNPMSEGFTGSPAGNVPTRQAGEIDNIPASVNVPPQPIQNIWPEHSCVPQDYLDPSDYSSHREPLIPSNEPAPNEEVPASTRCDIGDQWDDDLDYSSSKGKAVRAYDEFKRGLRHGERESWDLNVAADPEDDKEEEEYSDDDSEEEESEIEDGDLKFIRIPWPSIEHDDLSSRREDAEVVEIRVGDDETLESILEDISLRDERRKKGKGVEGRVECVGEPERRREDVRITKGVAV